MQLTLDDAQVARLTAEQKKAILQSFYLVLAVDRQVDPAEHQGLEDEVKKVSWGIESAEIHGFLVDARDRVLRTKEREEWVAWVRELVQQIPAEVHVPVIATMARLGLVNDLNQHERGLLNVFAMTMGLTQDVADQLKAALAPR
jgi:hypothetical protein